MGLPGKRRTKSSKLRRAAHFALLKVKLITCPKCKKPILWHRVCSSCGYYRGQEVMPIKIKTKKKKKSKK